VTAEATTLLLQHAASWAVPNLLSGPLAVTSRTVVRLFLEQLWFEFVPVFHRLQGCFAAQDGLRKLLVVEPDVAMQSRLQFFTGSEVVAL
jgi:hypothetical protein